MSFVNAHIHLFTIQHVPNRFLPLGLVRLLKPKLIRKPLTRIMETLIPFTDRDLLDRYVNFVELTANKTQRDTLIHIMGYYPGGTRFVVLPMDMAYMAAGKVKTGLVDQLDELSALYQELPEVVIPFVPVDPRRKDAFDIVKRYVEEHDFKGIKLYPRLGFYPTDERLYPIYEYASRHNLPVMTHCSRGGVYTRKVTNKMLKHPVRGNVVKTKAKDFSHYFTEPANYKQVLSDFPNLRVCLAHFGGNSEWDRYLETAWNPLDTSAREKSWVSEIVDMMKTYPNLYTDISYTAFHSERYFPLMSIYLDDERINDRILFGSDYYMIERVKKTEREMSLKIRYALGEEKFKLISETNTAAYLGDSPVA